MTSQHVTLSINSPGTLLPTISLDGEFVSTVPLVANDRHPNIIYYVTDDILPDLRRHVGQGRLRRANIWRELDFPTVDGAGLFSRLSWLHESLAKVYGLGVDSEIVQINDERNTGKDNLDELLDLALQVAVPQSTRLYAG